MKLNYGKFDYYINKNLLERTNFVNYLTQEIIDRLNEVFELGEIAMYNKDEIHLVHDQEHTDLMFKNGTDYYRLKFLANKSIMVIKHYDSEYKETDKMVLDKNGIIEKNGDYFKTDLPDNSHLLEN